MSHLVCYTRRMKMINEMKNKTINVWQTATSGPNKGLKRMVEISMEEWNSIRQDRVNRLIQDSVDYLKEGNR